MCQRPCGRPHTFILAILAAVALALAGPLAIAPLASSARAAAPGSADAAAPTAAAAPTSATCRNSGLLPTKSDLPAVDAATVCLIDRERRAAHLRRLRPNRRLQHVASIQSAEMVLGDYFGDDDRSGQTPLQRIVATHYLRRAASASTAQNIGWGTGLDATPAAMIAAWMASAPHRQIILTGAFRDIGVGVAPAAPAALAQGKPGATYTVEFGARQR